MPQFERPSWNRVKHLLGAYDGSASEIFVIDLPASQYEHVVTTIEHLPDLEVTASQNYALEHPERYDSSWSQRLRTCCEPASLHLLLSANQTERHLQIYLCTPDESDMFDVEFVFWNDLTFPARLTGVECESRLARLLSIAETCRTGVPASRCILSSEHNGDPRELLDCDHAVIW